MQFALVKWLKKVIVKYFTKNPYQVRSFQTLYQGVLGQQVDVPESVSCVLRFEAGTSIYFPKPTIVNQESGFIRYVGAEPRFLDSGLFKTPDRFVYSLSMGSVIGQMGLVYDSKKRSFVNESSSSWVLNLNDLPYLSAINLPPIVSLQGITVSLLSIGADGGFYHFIFESLVKLKMLEGMLERASQLLLNGPETDWKKKWLSKAGVDLAKIIWVNESSHFSCTQLIFTNRLVTDQQINRWSIDSLRELFFPNSNQPEGMEQDIFWITRKGDIERNLIWEESILKRYKEIESIDLNLLSVDETKAKFQSAKLIIAPHGAGLSNLFLASPGTRVLELFPTDTKFKPLYSRLAAICKLQHKGLFLNFRDEADSKFGMELFSAVLQDLKDDKSI